MIRSRRLAAWIPNWEMGTKSDSRVAAANWPET